MSTGREHIVALPTFFFILRVAQIVLSIIVLGLVAYCTHYVKDQLSSFITVNSLALAIFTVVWTWLILAYYLTSTLALTTIYNLWAVLALEVLTLIFWLVSMATLAKDAGCLYGDLNACYSGSYSYKIKRAIVDLVPRRSRYSSGYSSGYSISDYYSGWNTFKGCFAGAAGLAGLMFLLFIITLVFFSIQLNRHRKSGAPATAGGSASGADPAAPQSYGMVPQAEKGQATSTAAPVPQYPPQQGAPVDPNVQYGGQPQQYYPPPQQQQQPVYSAPSSPPPNTYEASATPAPYQPSVSPVSQPPYGQAPPPQQYQ